MRNILLFTVMILAASLNGQGHKALPSSGSHVAVSPMLANPHTQKYHIDPRIHTYKSATPQINPSYTTAGLLSEIRYDSSVTWIIDSMHLDWTFSSRDRDYTYDANGNLTSLVYQTRENDIWVNSEKYMYGYDANNNRTSIVHQVWNTSSWENDAQYLSTYTPFNALLTSTGKYWNGNTWLNNTKSTYTYDAGHKQTMRLDQTWNISVWEDFEQNLFTYDAEDNNTEELIQLWDGSEWYNYSRIVNTYLPGHLTETVLDQFWNGSSWDSYNLTTLYYDKNMVLQNEISQYWDGSDWANQFKINYTLDANGNIILTRYFQWVGFGWVKTTDYLDYFDTSNFLTDQVTNYYNSTGQGVTARDSSHYYFHMTTGTHDVTLLGQAITIYPNPSEGHITVLGDKPFTDIIIYQLEGKPLLNISLSTPAQTIETDLGQIGPGIYLLYVNSEAGSLVRKLVVY